MHPPDQTQPGFKRQVVFRIGAEDWPTLETAAREYGSIQAAVIAGLRALKQPDQVTPTQRQRQRMWKSIPSKVSDDGRLTRPNSTLEPPAPAHDLDEEIRAREAAKLLGLKTSTVSGYIRAGRLPGRYDTAPNWLGWVTTHGAVAAYRARKR